MNETPTDKGRLALRGASFPAQYPKASQRTCGDFHGRTDYKKPTRSGRCGGNLRLQLHDLFGCVLDQRAVVQIRFYDASGPHPLGGSAP